MEHNLLHGWNSLRGLWVGDCIGNIGQLYFAHDILKALDEGIVKFGADAINPHGKSFQYSDDTEEAIVLLNHLAKNKEIKQDELAYEFGKRYFERDPDGEIFGYGLMTRKVLREIYEGKPWREANQTQPKIEGPSFVDNLLVNIIGGKSISDSMTIVNAELKEKIKSEPQMKIGSCGNGSAMRVAPLGAFFVGSYYGDIVKQATLQSEVTHCHTEGIAGAIAVSILANDITRLSMGGTSITVAGFYHNLLKWTPNGQVFDGIRKASELPLDTPLGKLIEILGNGTHVTCQDTVPLCVFLTIRAVTQCKKEEAYEKVIIEACKCFGDVDTNCAIIGGMIGAYSPPPEKWVRYCQPMEGLLGEPLPEKREKRSRSLPMSVTDILKETTPWDSKNIEDQVNSIWESEKVISDVMKKPQPTFEEVLSKRKKELGV